MLLKELYNTKIDRMTQENYTRHLFQTFGIEVYEVAECRYTGFIKRNATYHMYVPILVDGDIRSLKHDDMRHYYCADIAGVKYRMKEWCRNDPEMLYALHNAVCKMKKTRKVV